MKQARESENCAAKTAGRLVIEDEHADLPGFGDERQREGDDRAHHIR